MSTISELLADARLLMNDSGSKPQYPDRVLLRVLNCFGSEIKAINRDISLSNGFKTSSGKWQYNFPVDMWYPVSARYNDGDKYYPVTILDPANFSELDFRSGEETGEPRFISVRDKKFVVFPTPDGIYNITFEMVTRWDDITIDDIEDDFGDWFDQSYEKYAINYLVLNSLKSNNELVDSMRADFYRVGGQWEFIRKMESMKFRPFNAKNRRTAGVTQNKYGDYNSGAIL